MQITSYNSHSASFGPSAVRVNAETVYSGRREADLVMTSTGQVECWEARCPVIRQIGSWARLSGIGVGAAHIGLAAIKPPCGSRRGDRAARGRARRTVSRFRRRAGCLVVGRRRVLRWPLGIRRWRRTPLTPASCPLRRRRTLLDSRRERT